MDPKTIETLIEHIWTIEDQLRANLRTLQLIEITLAEEAED